MDNTHLQESQFDKIAYVLGVTVSEIRGIFEEALRLRPTKSLPSGATLIEDPTPAMLKLIWDYPSPHCGVILSDGKYYLSQSLVIENFHDLIMEVPKFYRRITGNSLSLCPSTFRPMIFAHAKEGEDNPIDRYVLMSGSQLPGCPSQ